MSLDILEDRFWKAAIVRRANVIITQIYVIEKAVVVWLTVKIIPLVGIVNDVKMVHMGTPPNKNVEVSSMIWFVIGL